MTTKVKIITGFILMIALIGGLAVLGYRSANNATQSFIEYQRRARLNTESSDLATDMAEANSAVNEFLLGRQESSMATARQNINEALKRLDTAKGLAALDSEKKGIDALIRQTQAFLPLIDEIQKAAIAADKHFSDVLTPAARTMLEKIDQIDTAAAANRDVEALTLLVTTLRDLGTVRAGVSRFAANRAEADKKIVQANLKTMTESMQQLTAVAMADPKSKAAMNEFNQIFADYGKGFAALVALTDATLSANERMDRTVEQTLAAVSEFNASCDAAMRAFGQATREESAAVEKEMIGTGLAGLLIGLAVALFIVIGLTRTLKTLSAFATEVSRGNFETAVNVREKGEIGDMVTALKAIPEVLAKVMDEARDLSHRILVGDFRKRMNQKDFSGSFAGLAETINTVGDAYTNTLDNIPTPMMTCDAGKKIVFLNKAAQGAVGGNFVSEPCAGHLNADACGSNCFGEACLRNNAAYTNETTVRPQVGQLEVSVTAIPLKDERGVNAGFLELLTDLTEVKTQQKTILRVAHEASEIADRVAAASEEIAAQVEQISRGAEVQRERVESTASAMAEMNSTVLEVARNAGQASDQTSVTKNKAESGANLVRQVVLSIQHVNEVSHAMQKNMEELGGQAESIGSVMSVISDIADQTNLLALNAAIEAARAGEAGRGFAVVADEVRKLAEKTMTATQEVGSNITAIQSSTRRNIESMQSAAKGVAEATDLASSSGDALAEIVSLATENSSVVTSIATAAEQQSATSEEINHAIEEINRIVGETTEGMTQSSAAVQELSSMTQNLRRIIESLR